MEDDIGSPLSPPTSGFFSQRAKFNPKKTAEELQAAQELVKKIEQENTKTLEIQSIMTPANKTRKKLKKNDQSRLQNDSGGIPDDSFSEVILSSASKRKLKKLRDQQDEELQHIEAENQRILSAVDMNSDYSIEALQENTEEFEKIVVITIMYMSKISRLKCYENDKFLDIFPKVAELLDLKVTEFLLCLKTRNISVDDTPKSLKLTDQDVIECIPYKAEVNTEIEAKDSGNSFKISFQTNDTKKKIDMLVHKMETMQDIMQRYSEERKIPLEQLIFDFDGERLSGEETPADLDMESESCIDVTVLVPKPTPKAPNRRGRKKK